MALAYRADKLSRSRSNGHVELGRQGNSGGIITCYVTQPDNVVLHIDVDSKAEGQELLDKVCKKLGIMEEGEYFGIQYATSKGDPIWLNMRNRLSRQLPGSQKYSLFFKVKYFVPPHTLLLEETRHQFYLNVKNQLTLGLWDAECSLELQARLIALMAHAQFGPFNPATTPCKYACFWADQREEISREVIRMVANFHKELADMTTLHAEYELIRIAHSEVPAYGVYFYDVRDIFDRRLLMGVGPDFIAVCKPDMTFIDRYPYCRLQTVTVTNRVVTLNLLEDDGSSKAHHYQLSGTRTANSLYREITEVHCFFRCDTVRDSVLSQTNQNFNNPITAIFDHNIRDFTFDVHLTCREVYDSVRRRIFHSATELAVVASAPVVVSSNGSMAGNSCSPQERVQMDPLASYHCGLINRQTTETVNSHSDSAISSEEVEELIQERIREVAKCKVCADKNINRMFFPCGHAMCCEECADRVDQCPVCRQQIEMRHPVFLPWGDVDAHTSSPTSHHYPNITLKRQHNDSLVSTGSSPVPCSGVNFALSFDSNTQSLPSLPRSTSGSLSTPSKPNPPLPSQEARRTSSFVEMPVDASVTTADSSHLARPLRSVAFAVQDQRPPTVSPRANKPYNHHTNFNFFHRRRHRSRGTPEASSSGQVEPPCFTIPP